MNNLDMDAVLEACEHDDNTGFCINCGAEVDGVEPDARNYHCEECGQNKVFGAPEILIEFAF